MYICVVFLTQMDEISLAKKVLNDSEGLKSDIQDSLPVS